MVFLRSCTLALWLAATASATTSTPIRDLSSDPINDSHCDWPNFEEDDDLNGVMVLYRGHKLAEWRNPSAQQTDWLGLNFKPGTTQHAQYSITKTWTGVLTGMLYRDGFLDWDTEHPDQITLGDIFPDEGVWDEMWDIPYVFHGGSKVPELKRITLSELMSMRTGYSEGGFGSPFDSNLVRDLDRLVAWWHPMYRAGAIESQTCFNCANYLGSTGIVNYIIKQKTKTRNNPDGWDPLDYARQTSRTLPNGNVGLFEALGMEEGSYAWDLDCDGVARAAFGLWTDLEDMAKFGQLLLQGGKVLHNGVEKEVIPSYFFEGMTSTQSRHMGVNLPYGWLLWNWGEDDDGDSGFCAEGLGWQTICVFPNEETVVAIQAPITLGVETFFANIGFRNDAVKAIRDGIVCSPTSAPISPSTPSPSSSSTPSPTSGDGISFPTTDVPVDSEDDLSSGSGTNTGSDAAFVNGSQPSQSNKFLQDAEEDPTAVVGLVIGLVLALAIICCLITLLLCTERKRRNRKEDIYRTADVKIIPDWNTSRAYKIADDDDLSKQGSVNTVESDGVTVFVEKYDIEQRSY